MLPMSDVYQIPDHHPMYPTKFVGCGLGAQGCFNDSADGCIVGVGGAPHLGQHFLYPRRNLTHTSDGGVAEPAIDIYSNR